ncbi:MAG: SpoIIE family protein phosphatase [Acidobacteriota bacterium]|nr:SpoIIE family protein phosphatase [Acidobacteriota bacterium]
MATVPGGEMAARIAAFDWAASPLGPVSGWSPTLRASLNIALASRFPFIIWWGPQLVVLYNDAYMPFLGAKHPGALGQPGLSPAAWGDKDVRLVIEPMLRGVYDQGEATWSEDQLLILERHGFPEETYFTWSYSPIYESGAVVGIFTAVTETSASVIGARRLRVLSDLAAATFEASTVEAVSHRSAEVLDSNRREVAFHLTYLNNAAGEPELIAGTPEAVSGAPHPAAWTERDRNDIRTAIVDLAAIGFTVQSGEWPEPVSKAAVVPLVGAGEQRHVGFMVIGLSPRLVHDDGYLDFLRLAAERVSSSISDARLLEQERHRAEAFAQLDRSKSLFLSNVSHEFRTPLTLMLGPLDDALADGGRVPWSVQEERLSTARGNGLRLLKLVNTLLDFSRLEAGRPRVDLSAVEVGALTEDLAGVFRSAFTTAGLSLEVEVERLDVLVELDVDMWETVVFNLLSNALKYTSSGRVTVNLRRDANDLVLAVSDTGSGVPPDEHERIFERFHRASHPNGRSLEGTGIGLALVRELLALHGGTIALDSEVGRGSTFTVRLPLRQSASTTAQATRRAGMRAESFLEETRRWMPESVPDAGWSASDGSRPYVLVVDDNADMRRYLRNLLQDRYDVTVAADGAAALEEVRRRRPDAVISDVMMPVLDGFGLLDALRRDDELRDLPIMLVSARAGSEATGEGLERGADDYLVKPFAAREMRARVEALLNASARLGATGRDRTRRQRRAAAADLAAALNSVTTVQLLAETVFVNLGPTWNLVTATIGLLEPDGTHVAHHFGGSDRTPRLSGRLARVEIGADTPHARAVRDGSPQLFETRAELLADFPALAEDATEHGLEGSVTFPFVAADHRIFGALTLGWQIPLALDSETVTELSDIAEVVARATERVVNHQMQREVAAGLQRSLLTLDIRSTDVLARALYRSAQAEIEVGGDWYDAVDLGDGRLAVAVGDVVGRGLSAATTMGQLRAAMAAAAIAAPGPSQALDILDRYAAPLPGSHCATAALAFVDTAAGELHYSRAGHLPPVIVTPDGTVAVLDGGGSWPFNVGLDAPRPAAERASFPPGSLLLLYTDGLVERRGESLQVGIERLADIVQRHWQMPLLDLERHLVGAMLDGRERTDDVALLALRSAGQSRRHFAKAVAADPKLIRPLRHHFAAWLAHVGVDEAEVDDLVLATGEALANAVEHGSGNDPERVVGLEAGVLEGLITVAVTDSGRWKAGLEGFLAGRGRGHTLIQALVDDLRIESDTHGTSVVMVRNAPTPRPSTTSGDDSGPPPRSGGGG